MKRMIRPALAALGLAMLASGMAKAQPAPSVSVADYRRAEAMLAQNIRPKLLNATLDPVWLPAGDRFWYRHETADGGQYLEVDPARATRWPAFDAARLATAVAAVTGKPADAARLQLGGLTFLDPDGRRIGFSAQGFDLKCDLAAYACAGAPSKPEDTGRLVSPDGRWAVFAKDDNLWLRDLATGQARALTTDGEPHFAYGKLPDNALLRVISQTKGFALPLYGVDWSPDSRHVVVDRTDERALQDYPFLQLAPYDGDRRPRVVEVRTALSGGTARMKSQTAIIDIGTGAVRPVTVKGGLSITHYWDPSSRRFLVMEGGDYSREETLYEVDVASAAARAVLSETSKTFLQTSPLEYDEPAIRFLPQSNEVIWYSQRDGWGHLYLVDVASGRIKAKLTDGPWTIQNIVHVDPARRELMFTAAGREAGPDPYWRRLYSVRLDGTGLKLLTPEPADHDFPGAVNPAVALALKGLVPVTAPASVAPDGRYLIDTYSTLDTPPVSVLRRADGSVVTPLETADASAVYAAGWSAPKPFKVKAADGVTELYGYLILPHGFDPARKYPLIDAIYNGPQVVTTPHDFAGAVSGLFADDAQAFAQLGFVVLIMDGRGTPMRSKAFQDYIYNNMQAFGVEDHVAAIKQLAARDPFIDADRVGVYGHSFGGYTSMKAMLGFPEVFKVGASSAGPYDLYGMYSLDSFFAPPIYAGGGTEPASPADRPTNWGQIDLTAQAANLKGKLMLGFADLDENAYPAEAARMVNALIAANKSFELVYMPNRSHGFSGEGYFRRRRWDFFVRNLLGAEPPTDYRMGGDP